MARSHSGSPASQQRARTSSRRLRALLAAAVGVLAGCSGAPRTTRAARARVVSTVASAPPPPPPPRATPGVLRSTSGPEPSDAVACVSAVAAAPPSVIAQAVVWQSALWCTAGSLVALAHDGQRAYLSFAEPIPSGTIGPFGIRQGTPWLLEIDGRLAQRRLGARLEQAVAVLDARGHLHVVHGGPDENGVGVYNHVVDRRSQPVGHRLPPMLQQVVAGGDGNVAALFTGPPAVVASLSRGAWRTREVAAAALAFDRTGALWIASPGRLASDARSYALQPDELPLGVAMTDDPVVALASGLGVRVRWLGSSRDAELPAWAARSELSMPIDPAPRVQPPPGMRTPRRALTAQSTVSWVGEAGGAAWVVVAHREIETHVGTTSACRPVDPVGPSGPFGPYCEDIQTTYATDSRREALLFRASQGTLELAARVPMDETGDARLGDRVLVAAHGDILTLAWGTAPPYATESMTNFGVRLVSLDLRRL